MCTMTCSTNSLLKRNVQSNTSGLFEVIFDTNIEMCSSGVSHSHDKPLLSERRWARHF